MNTIAIIDYGMGNLHSIAKALERVTEGVRIEITDDPTIIEEAERVVFPGQGAIGQCMRRLRERRLDALLPRLIETRPVLGICLGLQAVLGHSDENGGTEALGLLEGRVRRFPEGLNEYPGGPPIRIPHMGWNHVEPATDHPLWHGIPRATRFYFVHSYYAPAELAHTAATTDYGVRFASALAKDNLFAVQFHPEKSHRFGLQLLANFAAWTGGD